jgi:anti-anti-sigma regulatory factor
MVFGGEYDIACKEHLKADLAPLSGAREVVLEFTDVTYIDSSVIVELIRLHQARDAKGHPPMTIVVQNRQLKKVFALLHLESLFQFADNLGAVLPPMQTAIGLHYTSCGPRASCSTHAGTHRAFEFVEKSA